MLAESEHLFIGVARISSCTSPKLKNVVIYQLSEV